MISGGEANRPFGGRDTAWSQHAGSSCTVRCKYAAAAARDDGDGSGYGVLDGAGPERARSVACGSPLTPPVDVEIALATSWLPGAPGGTNIQ